MKRTWAGLLALTLLVGVAPQIATAAVKAGATCTKLKSTATVSGYKYTCIKSGKKLVWSKGVKVVATPKPTASPSVTATPTPSASATPTPTPSVTATPTPSASSSQTSTTADKYADQPCKTEGEDLKTDVAAYKCVKRSDSGSLLWSKNNQTTDIATPSPSAGETDSTEKDYSEQPCNTENQLFETKTTLYLCVKRSDSSLLWSNQNQNNQKPTSTRTSDAPVDQYQNQPCEEEGKPFIAKTAQYVCFKVDGKLILSMNNGRPYPKPSQMVKPIASIPTNLAEIQKIVNKSKVDPSVCKVKQNSDWVKNATAFPFQPTALPIKGKIDVAVVFVDWEDSPGTAEDYKFYQEQVKMFEDFYWMVSENTLDMNPVFSKKWFRIPGSQKNFVMSVEEESQRGDGSVKQKFYDAAVKASDPETDYSGIEIVIFAIPTGKLTIAMGLHEFNIDYNAYLKTAEGNIYDTVTAGDSFIIPTYQPPWVLYVHEAGHMIGVPHQADESFNGSAASQKYQHNPLGGWDIMSFQGGGTRTITSWLRWLAGWLKDEQVACTTKEKVTNDYYELQPINKINGEVESLVIKISDSKVIVVESRRPDPYFDIETGNSKEGVIVYTVDANKGSAQGNQAILSPRDISKYLYEDNIWWDWKELDAIFFQGDSIVYEGMKIEVFYSGKDSDIVKVSKVG